MLCATTIIAARSMIHRGSWWFIPLVLVTVPIIGWSNAHASVQLARDPEVLDLIGIKSYSPEQSKIDVRGPIKWTGTHRNK